MSNCDWEIIPGTRVHAASVDPAAYRCRVSRCEDESPECISRDERCCEACGCSCEPDDDEPPELDDEQRYELRAAVEHRPRGAYFNHLITA